MTTFRVFREGKRLYDEGAVTFDPAASTPETTVFRVDSDSTDRKYDVDVTQQNKIICGCGQGVTRGRNGARCKHTEAVAEFLKHHGERIENAINKVKA